MATATPRSVDISCPSTFNTRGDPTNLGSSWKKWRQGFDLYLIAAGITSDPQKEPLLLHCGGQDLREIFDTLPECTNDELSKYEKACKVLDDYFLPKQNKRYERHVFRSCQQKESEPIAQYVTRLRSLAKTCQFNDANDEIVDQVIENVIQRN